MKPIICHELWFRYHARAPWIIQNFSHEFQPGIVVIKGASGCGKSTLLRMLAGYLQPSRGIITTPSGRPPTCKDYQRQEVGFVFQQLNLLPLASVERNLEMAGSLAGLNGEIIRQRTGHWLQTLGLGEFGKRRPSSLSGGQQQRAAIARALVKEPQILLLDEPTSALDVLTQANIFNVLKRLKKELGVSFILITHDIATSSELADEIAIMYAGQIVETGSAKDFFPAPLHPYSQMLMASVPRLRSDSDPMFITGQPPSLMNPPSGCRFAARCPFRFARCSEEPPVFQRGNRKVKCWLHE